MTTFGEGNYSPREEPLEFDDTIRDISKVNIPKVARICGITEQSVQDVLEVTKQSADIQVHLKKHSVTDEIVMGWIWAEMFWMLPIGGIAT